MAFVFKHGCELEVRVLSASRSNMTICLRTMDRCLRNWRRKANLQGRIRGENIEGSVHVFHLPVYPRDFCASSWQFDITLKTRETHGKIVPETWEVWFWIMFNIPSCYSTDKKGNIRSIRKMTVKNNESRVPLQVKCPCIRMVIFGICISLFLRLNSDTKYRFACSVWSNNQC